MSDSDIAGAASALGLLRPRVKADAEPIFRAAKGRLDDGAQKLADSQKQFDDLVKQHEEYAAELDHDLSGLDPGLAIPRDNVWLDHNRLTGSERLLDWVLG